MPAEGLRGLVLEGVTGAGKSHLLQALGRRGGFFAGATIVFEEETLGEAMDEELRDERLAPAQKTWRLGQVLERVEAAPGERFVLERFHPTYHALLPQWPLYEPIDARLAALGFGLVLLAVDEAALARRALHRVDRPGWAAGMSAYYGSEPAALEAIVQSQRRRIEALERTRLRALRLDTTAADWEQAADAVCAFVGG